MHGLRHLLVGREVAAPEGDLEAVGVAGFGEQRLRLLRVERIREPVLEVRRERREEAAGRNLAEALDRPHEALLVDGVRDRLAYAEIGHGLVIEAERDVVDVVERALEELGRQIGCVLERRERSGRNRLRHHVLLAVLDPQQRELGIDADRPLDAVEVGHVGVPVVREALEHEASVRIDVGHAVRARADGREVEPVTGLLDDVARHDARERQAQQVEQHAVRRFQLDRERERVDDGDARELVAGLVEDVLHPRDRQARVEATALARGRRGDEALERVLDVVGRQLAAVVELDPGA